MSHKKQHVKKWVIWAVIIAAFVGVLLAGPIFINYIFIAEEINWNISFTPGETLQYYGLILGGLVTGIAIITTVHLNSVNRLKDKQREQFERAYKIYHKLPDVLTKLELAAVHVRYALRLEEEKLIEAFDVMKESESALREHHYKNDVFYSREIEDSLKDVLSVSSACEESVEKYLADLKSNDKDLESARSAMEEAFAGFRDGIVKAKEEISGEINKFVSVYDNLT